MKSLDGNTIAVPLDQNRGLASLKHASADVQVSNKALSISLTFDTIAIALISGDHEEFSNITVYPSE